MALLLATDEAFHQERAPGQPPDYLRPFITFLREGGTDGSLDTDEDIFETADVLFNAVAWTYVHLRGRHEWPADRARARVAGVVLNGVAPQTNRQQTRKGSEMSMPYAEPLVPREPAPRQIPEPARRGEPGGPPCAICTGTTTSAV